MKLLLKIENGINAICKALSFVAIFTIVVVAFFQVIGRYVFNYGSPWTDELCNYLQIFITYVGMAYLVSTKGHLAVDLIRNGCPPKAAKVLDILGIICGIVFSCYVIRYGLAQSINQMNQRCNGLPITFGLVYLVPLPFGGLLSAVNGIIALVKTIAGYNPDSQDNIEAY